MGAISATEGVWREPLISPEGWEMIERFEGWRSQGYVPRAADGSALGQSGVTIGAGVDLGHWSVEQLTRRGVPAGLIDKLRPYLGLRGAAAIAAAPGLRLSIREIDQLSRPIRRAILESLVDRYDKAAAPHGLEWRKIPVEARSVIASVAFQYGPALSRRDRAPRFWSQITRGDWQGAYRNLLNFGDEYPTRRRQEAAVLRTVLKP